MRCLLVKTIAKREVWVDNVKVIACILVVLGHFYQSMIRSGIIQLTDFYMWFSYTLYTFHVPLFFICSGYLYQRFSCIDCISSWSRNLLKKAIVLGVPYFVFSILIWCVKRLFSDAVNIEVGGLADTLFINPISPYWYLYTLFFVFAITVTFRNKKAAIIGLFVALCIKAFSMSDLSCDIRSVKDILDNEIWFVTGMCLHVFDFKRLLKNKRGLAIGSAIGGTFLVVSVLIYIYKVYFYGVSFLLGIMACASIILIIATLYINNVQSSFFEFMAEYTMPIFLMHALFAAGIRVILFRLGIDNSTAHVIFGLFASFIGPIIAGMIMKKIKHLEFFMYPGKFIKI